VGRQRSHISSSRAAAAMTPGWRLQRWLWAPLQQRQRRWRRGSGRCSIGMTRDPPVGPSQAENALVSARATAVSLLALLWVRLLSLFGCLHDEREARSF